MGPTGETEALRLDARSVRASPHGTARTLGRVTLGTLVTTCLSGLVLSAIYPGAGPQPVMVLFGFLLMATVALSALTAMTQLWTWIAPARRASLVIDAAGVHVTRGRWVRTIARSRVRAGWTVRDGARYRAELRARGGNVLSTTCESEAEANAVLDAAGVAADRRALTLQLGGPLVNVGIALSSVVPSSCVSGVLVATLGSLLPASASAAMGFLMFTLIAAGMPLALKLFGPPSVQVGRDGVSVRAGLRQWFVSFSDLVGVRSTGVAISLSLRDGRVRTIPTIGTRAALRDALVERIQAGISQTESTIDLSARLAVLDRAGRSLEAWTDALRTVATDEDYRHSGLSRDELLAVLDDPHAPPERRIAATFALAHLDKGKAVERVRVVLESTAHEPVRVALERAAEGSLDEESLAAAVEERVRVG
jgi:hypothetical protein